jgi:hypothetical protein
VEFTKFTGERLSRWDCLVDTERELEAFEGRRMVLTLPGVIGCCFCGCGRLGGGSGGSSRSSSRMSESPSSSSDEIVMTGDFGVRDFLAGTVNC